MESRFRVMYRRFIPIKVRISIRQRHRRFVFTRALRSFIREPLGNLSVNNQVFSQLVYGWGNEYWSALDEYLISCCKHKLEIGGPSLECGSGLSTILIGVIADATNQEHWALEHNQDWAKRVSYYLKKHNIQSVNQQTADLKDYGEYSWYQPQVDTMPDSFSLIICDGPPSSVHGGRYGLLPCMKGKIAKGTTILFDDVEREKEKEILESWCKEFNMSYEIQGKEKPFAIIKKL